MGPTGTFAAFGAWAGRSFAQPSTDKTSLYTWHRKNANDAMFQASDFRLVTRADVAHIFGVCVKTIDNYIEQGLLPQPVSFASKEYWHPEDIRTFLDETFRRATAQPRSVRSSIATVSPKEDAAGPLVNEAAPKAGASPQGSHPVVKAKARQDAILRRLNSGG